MELHYKNYIIKHEPYAHTRFNLYKIVTVKKEGAKHYGEKYEQALAYGLTLATCAAYIASDISGKDKSVKEDEIITYLKDYEKRIKDICSHLDEEIKKYPLKNAYKR